MSIKKKVKAVEKLYEELSREMQLFTQGTNLHCVSGCGKCCFKPDIDATILEFLPLALHLHTQGEAEKFLEKLKTFDSSQVCAVLLALGTDKQQGKCTQYNYRGMICRLFGFSLAFDKYGSKRLSTCNVIKTERVPELQRAEAWIKEGRPAPVMRNYYFRLCNIDYRLTEKFYPINTAIRLALEEVLAYYSYRSPLKAS
ncbi:YkgJ family cysteine cluster protein [Porifericola rhodea]|uniref:YkgJ family cysteine cluster protein n=1 Tax=Porifericola rhodea TaxID=930972 RepID=UPI0026663AE8|nr:YkgJ family cysteine cluster protein [Porifericola rhodea]WKN30574.1 YkgJ family cysteine cluster protein [Porifericola rhodea]